MSKSEPHWRCADVVRQEMAKLGAEVTVSTARPLVMNPYVEAIQCPHGTTFYYEPTSDQIAAWARDGVR
ncbi:hypothetical protein [Micromonospora chersina]